MPPIPEGLHLTFFTGERTARKYALFMVAFVSFVKIKFYGNNNPRR